MKERPWLLRIEGKVLKKDPESGIRKLERAGKLGYDDAFLALGRIYEEGKVTGKDPEKAFASYLSASYGEHREAPYRLGLLYITGTGTGKDVETGCACLEDALEHGNPLAGKALEKYCSGADAGMAAPGKPGKAGR